MSSSAKIEMTAALSLESLTAWLEKQPAEMEYDFLNICGCLYFQYLSAAGLPVRSVGGDYYRATDRETIALPEPFPSIANERPHNFGAALERARTALSYPVGREELKVQS